MTDENITPPPPAAPTPPPTAPSLDKTDPPEPAAAPAYTQNYTPAPRTNVLAIIALILGIIVPIGGIITGHIALSQIKKTGEAGHGLALAGTILGYVLTVLGLIGIVLYIAFFALLFAHSGSSYYNSF
ncbi:hypothetical protein BH09ACT1_BH09ACT1_25430 [soil metagenome]